MISGGCLKNLYLNLIPRRHSSSVGMGEGGKTASFIEKQGEIWDIKLISLPFLNKKGCMVLDEIIIGNVIKLFPCKLP